VLAGTRAGKTSFGPWWLRREIEARGPGNYIVAAPNYPLLDKGAAAEVEEVFGRILRLGRMTRSPGWQFTFTQAGAESLWGPGRHDRTRIIFGHADDPDSLEAFGAKAAWLDECGQKKFKLGSWEAILRRLAIHEGRVLMTTTPYTVGWLKQEVHDRAGRTGTPQERPGDRDFEVISFESRMNPVFPRDEWERAQATLPRWKFDMFYRGRFARPAGMIYDCFDDGLNVCPRFAIPRDWPIYLGLDFGGVNTAAVWLAEEPHSTPTRYYAFRESLEGGRTAAGHVAAWLAPPHQRRPTITVGGSKSEGQWRQEFAAAGLAVKEPDQHEVEVGIDRVYGAVAERALVVFEDLAGLRDELGSYSRPTDERGEPQEGIEDKEQYHRLDALRYILGWLRRSAHAGPPRINLPPPEHRLEIHTKYRSAFK
jgi:hypothetical protein